MQKDWSRSKEVEQNMSQDLTQTIGCRSRHSDHSCKPVSWEHFSGCGGLRYIIFRKGIRFPVMIGSDEFFA